MQASSARQRWFQTGGGEVFKSAAAFVLMLSLAIFIYAAYRSYALRGRNEGDVVGDSQDPNAPGGPAAARREASPGDHPASNSPVGKGAPVTPGFTGAPGTVADPSAQIPASQIIPSQITPSQIAAPSAQAGTGAAPPVTDTIAPDPPNGLAFGGTGHFQVYRQGDITWRLNTQTGATCVLFATDAEWHRPRIRRSACRDTR